MKTKIALIVSLLALAGMAFYTTTFAQPSSGTGQKEQHPDIRRAIHALAQAEGYLKRANHDFGGHREAALKACDEASKQLQLALQYDKE